MSENKWLKVEHTLKYLLHEKGQLTEKDYFQADFLKSSIIALFGVKYQNDNNPIFKSNMLREANSSLDYFEERFPDYAYRLDRVRDYIKINFTG